MQFEDELLAGKPNVYGSIFRFEGQVSVFDAKRGPCYRCLFPEPPPAGAVPSCAEGGVLGVLPGIIGSLQALEVIKLILGKGEPLIARLVLFDALEFSFRELKLNKDSACSICGENPTITGPIDYAAFCGVDAAAQGRNAIAAMSVREFEARTGAHQLLDVRNPHEIDIVAIEGAMQIPLDELPGRLSELDANASWVVTCHKGARAEKACQLLREAGFTEVRVLEGGVDAWARDIDPSLARY